MLESGADVNFKDLDGKTPLDYADSRQMKTILIENGAVEIKSTNSEETLTRGGIRKGENKQGRKSQEEWEPFQDIKPF